MSKLIGVMGESGAGKTTMALGMAATLTSGGAWPDGTRCEQVGNVIMWSSEDDAADTLVPRLIAAGAKIGRASCRERV